MVSQCLKREQEDPVKQATVMTHEVLLKLVEHVDFSSELQAVAWVAVLVGFYLILRVSNLAPISRTQFSKRYCLTRSDVYWKKGFWTVGIRWSKTNQNMNKVVEAPLVPGRTKYICPQHWVTRMIKLIPAKPQEPLFLIREKGSRFPLTIGQINRLFKEWCKKADIPPGGYTSHCLRRGGLTWAHEAKITGETLQIMSDWASRAYMCYIDLDFEARVEAGKIMSEKAIY